MQHSSLAAFLNGELSAEQLWSEIAPEVKECETACAKGGAGHVIITDGPMTEIVRAHIAVLLSALANFDLPLDSASYIADALIMSDNFAWEDDAVAEALFLLSDESAPLTRADLERAQSQVETAL